MNLSPHELRDTALLLMVRRGQRMGMSIAESLAGTGIPVARVKRLLAQPRPKSPKAQPTQG